MFSSNPSVNIAAFVSSPDAKAANDDNYKKIYMGNISAINLNRVFEVALKATVKRIEFCGMHPGNPGMKGFARVEYSSITLS